MGWQPQPRLIRECLIDEGPRAVVRDPEERADVVLVIAENGGVEIKKHSFRYRLVRCGIWSDMTSRMK
jgi:hypothetical protein